MKFIKIVWILSLAVIIIFHIAFESFRIFDFITGNYNLKIMNISGYSYNTSSRSNSTTINGYIGKEKVYFSRFDDKIGELFSLYPGITMENNEIKELQDVFPNTFKKDDNPKSIEVLKFKNSNIVMLTKDNEFKRWKMHLYLFSLYSLISIIILILIKKK